MTRTTTRGTFLGLAGILVLTALVVAQQSGMSGPMSMETMMKACQTHCQETTAAIDQMKTTMEKARRSTILRRCGRRSRKYSNHSPR